MGVNSKAGGLGNCFTPIFLSMPGRRIFPWLPVRLTLFRQTSARLLFTQALVLGKSEVSGSAKGIRKFLCRRFQSIKYGRAAARQPCFQNIPYIDDRLKNLQASRLFWCLLLEALGECLAQKSAPYARLTINNMIKTQAAALISVREHFWTGPVRLHFQVTGTPGFSPTRVYLPRFFILPC